MLVLVPSEHKDRRRLSKVPEYQVALASFHTRHGLCPSTDVDDAALSLLSTVHQHYSGIGAPNLPRRWLARVFSAGDTALCALGCFIQPPVQMAAFGDLERRWALRAARLLQRLCVRAASSSPCFLLCHSASAAISSAHKSALWDSAIALLRQHGACELTHTCPHSALCAPNMVPKGVQQMPW